MARIFRCRGLRAVLAIAALGTATLTLGSTPALAATNTTTGGTTVAATKVAGMTDSCTAPTCVPIFDTEGVEFAGALLDPLTGQVVILDLTTSVIIGVVEQEGSTVVVIGASGSVIGTLFLNVATDQVVYAPV